MCQTSDDGYIIAANTQQNLWLIKTDSNGISEWDRIFGSGDDWGNTVHQTTDGGYIVSGYKRASTGAPGDVWLIKADSNGNKEWEKLFGGAAHDQARSMCLTNDNGYLIVGGTESFGEGLKDVWLIKTDSYGNEEWNTTFGGVNDDYGSSVIEALDGSWVIAGSIRSFSSGEEDVWLIKSGPDIP